MEIVENLSQWQAEFEAGWLAHWRQTGQTDFSLYPRMRNESALAGPGLDLAKSRLILISTAGAYLPESQVAFDAANPLGDYTIRRFPVTTPLESVAYAHTHYDHTAVKADPQVLIPLRHLADLVDEGVIGQLAPAVISFMGYQPDVTRTVHELIPAILAAVKAEAAQAALLVPA